MQLYKNVKYFKWNYIIYDMVSYWISVTYKMINYHLGAEQQNTEQYNKKILETIHFLFKIL